MNKAGIAYDNYYACEINKDAVAVTQANYPATRQLGNVKELNGYKLPKIDLLMGGSPCQDLSRANASGKGIEGARSGLFWEYARILKETNPTYFILENVIMQRQWTEIISTELAVEPIEINSNLVSCQNRRRLYWTNISGITQPLDKGIVLRDILLDDSYKNFTDERITKTKKLTKNYVKWDISGKGYYSQQDRAYFKDGKICTLPKTRGSNKLNIVVDYDKDIYRRSRPIEVERYQNVPDNYTDVENLSPNKRISLLGDGWTVDVIAHLLNKRLSLLCPT